MVPVSEEDSLSLSRRMVRAARAFPGLKGMDLAKVVTTRQVYQWNDGSIGRESAATLRAPLLQALRHE